MTGITFHEAAGVFMVKTIAPKGTRLGQHRHEKDHLSFLASGVARVSVEGDGDRWLTGPCEIVVQGGKTHEVEAVSDIVWLCLWGSDEGMQEDARESLKLLEA